MHNFRTYHLSRELSGQLQGRVVELVTCIESPEKRNAHCESSELMGEKIQTRNVESRSVLKPGATEDQLRVIDDTGRGVNATQQVRSVNCDCGHKREPGWSVNCDCEHNKKASNTPHYTFTENQVNCSDAHSTGEETKHYAFTGKQVTCSGAYTLVEEMSQIEELKHQLQEEKEQRGKVEKEMAEMQLRNELEHEEALRKESEMKLQTLKEARDRSKESHEDRVWNIQDHDQGHAFGCE